jgi:hypothetical protein
MAEQEVSQNDNKPVIQDTKANRAEEREYWQEQEEENK